ncbi:MAG: hypothetical protein ACO3XO_06990, partial [Bdellovibrionota bacterium]
RFSSIILSSLIPLLSHLFYRLIIVPPLIVPLQLYFVYNHTPVSPSSGTSWHVLTEAHRTRRDV